MPSLLLLSLRRSFLKHSSLAVASLLTTVGCSKSEAQIGNAAENPSLTIGINLTETVRDFSKHWNEMSATKNLSGMVALYTPDTLWTLSNEARSIGTNKVREIYKRLFQAQNMSLVHKTEKIAVSKSGDMATEIGSYELSTNTPQGEFKDRGKYFFLLNKVGGKWKIAADMFNSDTPVL